MPQLRLGVTEINNNNTINLWEKKNPVNSKFYVVRLSFGNERKLRKAKNLSPLNLL